jgi:hypothetical protein
MCEIPKKSRLRGEGKNDRDKKIKAKFSELKKEFHYYKYDAICELTGSFFDLGGSMVRKIIEK